MDKGNIEDIYSELTSYGGDEDASSRISGVSVYDGRGYYITTRLSDIQGAVITEYDYEDGNAPQRGIFIPFKAGGLTVTPKKNVLLVCKGEMAQVASSYTHLLTQITDKSVLDERRRLGFKQCFIGKMKPIGFKKKRKTL